MNLVLSLLMVLICLSLGFYSRWIWQVNQARRRGIYPRQGKGTLFDVRRLIVQGEKYLAIRLYCEIFQTTYPIAQQAVDELEQGIFRKNPDISKED